MIFLFKWVILTSLYSTIMPCNQSVYAHIVCIKANDPTVIESGLSWLSNVFILFFLFRAFPPSSSSSSPAQISWDFVWLFPRRTQGSEVTGGGGGDEDLGCMQTRCLGFHEAGEGQRQRSGGTWLFSITLINGRGEGRGAGGSRGTTHHC